MLTFSPLFAIVLVFKLFFVFCFFLHWFSLSRPFAPVSAEKFEQKSVRARIPNHFLYGY